MQTSPVIRDFLNILWEFEIYFNRFFDSHSSFSLTNTGLKIINSAHLKNDLLIVRSLKFHSCQKKQENQTTNYTNHTNTFFKCHPFHSCDSWSVFCFGLRARAVGNWNLLFICHLFFWNLLFRSGLRAWPALAWLVDARNRIRA